MKSYELNIIMLCMLIISANPILSDRFKAVTTNDQEAFYYI